MDKGPINNMGNVLPSLASNRGSDGPKLEEAKLKKACMEIESLFISHLLQFMRRTIPQSGFLGNGSGKDIYQNLFDQELGKSLAKRGSMGLGKMIYKQMIRKEEKIRPSAQELQSFPPLKNTEEK
jgi:Rod binding domain-containing protein